MSESYVPESSIAVRAESKMIELYQANIALLSQIDPTLIPSSMPLVPELLIACYQASTILDVGCGAGKKTAALAGSIGISVVGIDINDRAIQIAKEKCQDNMVRFLTKDASDVTELRMKFDVINMSAFLTCVVPRAAREAIITKCSECLTSRGIIVISDFLQSWYIPAYRHRYQQGQLDTGEPGSFAVTDPGKQKKLYYAHHFSDMELVETLDKTDLKALAYRRTLFVTRTGNYIEGFVLSAVRR